MLENKIKLEARHKMKLFFAYRPWEDEPDLAEWEDKETGYSCRIERNPMTGTLCGYVGVPMGDKFYGMSNDYKAQETDKGATIQAELEQISDNVHGGITYSGIQNGLWYFGFDTAHHGDFLPVIVERRIEQGDVGEGLMFYDCADYKTWDFVENEIKWLSWRLKKYNDYDKENEDDMEDE